MRGGEYADPGRVPEVLRPRGPHGQLRGRVPDHPGRREQAVHGVPVGSPQLGLLVIPRASQTSQLPMSDLYNGCLAFFKPKFSISCGFSDKTVNIVKICTRH